MLAKGQDPGRVLFWVVLLVCVRACGGVPSASFFHNPKFVTYPHTETLPFIDLTDNKCANFELAII